MHIQSKTEQTNDVTNTLSQQHSDDLRVENLLSDAPLYTLSSSLYASIAATGV